MRTLPRLIVTDLDNTLYDWTAYFTASFSAMVDSLVELFKLDRELLLDEFQSIHQKHGDSEYPFAVLEVPSVQAAVGSSDAKAILEAIDSALHAFNRTRKQTLVLYPGVHDTLCRFRAEGVIVVGHTEAIAENAFFRIRTLGLSQQLKHLYALDGLTSPHPRGSTTHAPPEPGYVRRVPRAERKPNPDLLRDICARESVAPSEAWYIGDSLTRDVSMAKAAGVRAIWARYGTGVASSSWEQLVRITHWSDADVRREVELKRASADVVPDDTLDEFGGLCALAGI